jgi:hypothetical protein
MGLALLLATGCAASPRVAIQYSPPPAAAPTSSPAVPAPTEPPVGTPAGPTIANASYFAGTRGVTAAELRYSWRPGCPVGPASLRALTVRYRTFSGAAASGTLIVNRDAVRAISAVFAGLYRRGFPIRRIQPVDVYKGSDDASTAADNTSAFNCRAAVASGPRSWSQHAYGRAIDVNPVENPYFLGGRVLPPAGKRYANRRIVRPGMAEAGLVRAFARVGWSWGGRWSSPDYQHFSSNGR